MATSGRRQSLVFLASHSFFGWNMPYDLNQARTWAVAAIDAHMPGGDRLVAQIDSIVAPTAAERSAAHTKLIELAEAGDINAATLLLIRAKISSAESDDGTLARLEKYVLLLPSDNRAAPILTKQLADTKQALAARAAATPSPEVIAERVARIESARDPQSDSVPALIYNEPPVYPYYLKASVLEERTAQVEFIVRPDGTPTDVHCVSSSHPLFAFSAENCIKNWRFAPGRKKGRAVAMRMIQPFRFNLKD
jgi:TonB family protein